MPKLNTSLRYSSCFGYQQLSFIAYKEIAKIRLVWYKNEFIIDFYFNKNGWDVRTLRRIALIRRDLLEKRKLFEEKRIGEFDFPLLVKENSDWLNILMRKTYLLEIRQTWYTSPQNEPHFFLWKWTFIFLEL